MSLVEPNLVGNEFESAQRHSDLKYERIEVPSASLEIVKILRVVLAVAVLLVFAVVVVVVAVMFLWG